MSRYTTGVKIGKAARKGATKTYKKGTGVLGVPRGVVSGAKQVKRDFSPTVVKAGIAKAASPKKRSVRKAARASDKQWRVESKARGKASRKK